MRRDVSAQVAQALLATVNTTLRNIVIIRVYLFLLCVKLVFFMAFEGLLVRGIQRS